MSVVNVSKFLGNLIFKKSVQKQTGIMKTINPMEKKLAENKAKFALEQIQKNNNIDINNLSANDFEMLAENIVNPIKNATQTPVKSADILDFRYKRNFAEELADASKKGDFKQMTGIMKVDPKFKEVMESLKASKAADAAKAKMIGPKKLIPDRDVIPYQSPEVQKLDFADKLKRSGLTEQEYMNNIVKKGYNVDDAIYARDFYGDTTDQIIKNANTKGAPVAFAGGGVAGLLGESPRQNFAMGKRAFLKMLGGVGAGIAGLKSGLLGFGKKEAAKKAVTETVKQTAGSGAPPPYFINLVKKIKNLGDDVTETGALAERQTVKRYKDYELTEDNVTGRQEITRMKIDDDLVYDSSEYYGKPLTEETYMSYTPGENIIGKGGKPVKTQPEYEEGTTLLRSDRGNAGDIVEESATISDDVIKEGTVFEDTLSEFGKADGGRIGYSKGKVVKEGIPALINKVKSLFGDDAITTADKIKRPQQALDREMFKKFKTNYPETVKSFLDKRQFLKSMVGNTEKNRKARQLAESKENLANYMKQYRGYKFPSDKQIRIDLEKRIQPILNKGRKLNATGGLANMLGE